ncbi:hypothetical protein [Streptomyces puniciscabiei]|nr:hypothetical protein [Streptomyces puniciscabiei]
MTEDDTAADRLDGGGHRGGRTESGRAAVDTAVDMLRLLGR